MSTPLEKALRLKREIRSLQRLPKSLHAPYIATDMMECSSFGRVHPTGRGDWTDDHHPPQRSDTHIGVQSDARSLLGSSETPWR